MFAVTPGVSDGCAIQTVANVSPKPCRPKRSIWPGGASTNCQKWSVMGLGIRHVLTVDLSLTARLLRAREPFTISAVPAYAPE